MLELKWRLADEYHTPWHENKNVLSHKGLGRNLKTWVRNPVTLNFQSESSRTAATHIIVFTLSAWTSFLKEKEIRVYPSDFCIKQLPNWLTCLGSRDFNIQKILFRRRRREKKSWIHSNFEMHLFLLLFPRMGAHRRKKKAKEILENPIHGHSKKKKKKVWIILFPNQFLEYFQSGKSSSEKMISEDRISHWDFP